MIQKFGFSNKIRLTTAFSEISFRSQGILSSHIKWFHFQEHWQGVFEIADWMSWRVRAWMTNTTQGCCRGMCSIYRKSHTWWKMVFDKARRTAWTLIITLMNWTARGNWRGRHRACRLRWRSRWRRGRWTWRNGRWSVFFILIFFNTQWRWTWTFWLRLFRAFKFWRRRQQIKWSRQWVCAWIWIIAFVCLRRTFWLWRSNRCNIKNGFNKSNSFLPSNCRGLARWTNSWRWMGHILTLRWMCQTFKLKNKCKNDLWRKFKRKLVHTARASCWTERLLTNEDDWVTVGTSRDIG